MRTAPLLIAAAAMLAAAGAAPALAWDEQGGMRSLPSGGLQLKDMPTTDSTIANLPGVNLNPQARDSGDAKCSQRRVSGYGYATDGRYVSGTATECSFGNFSITTVRPDPQPWRPGAPSIFGDN